MTLTPLENDTLKYALLQEEKTEFLHQLGENLKTFIQTFQTEPDGYEFPLSTILDITLTPVYKRWGKIIPSDIKVVVSKTIRPHYNPQDEKIYIPFTYFFDQQQWKELTNNTVPFPGGLFNIIIHEITHYYQYHQSQTWPVYGLIEKNKHAKNVILEILDIAPEKYKYLIPKIKDADPESEEFNEIIKEVWKDLPPRVQKTTNNIINLRNEPLYLQDVDEISALSEQILTLKQQNKSKEEQYDFFKSVPGMTREIFESIYDNAEKYLVQSEDRKPNFFL